LVFNRLARHQSDQKQGLRPKTVVTSPLAIDFAAVADMEHNDLLRRVVDIINDTVVADADISRASTELISFSTSAASGRLC
jgi:hypothetical protein